MKTYLFWLSAVLAAVLMAAPAGAQTNDAHFHHIHFNVMDIGESIQFYQRYLGAVPIKYHKVSDAVFTERSFFLFNQVDSPPFSEPKTAIMHIGWGGVDGPNEYEWLKREGVEFQTAVTALGSNYYMYFYGKDRELLEIYTGAKNHRFNHIHLWAKDVNETTQWFIDNLGLTARSRTRPKPEDPNGRWANSVRSDNVGIVIYGLPEKGASRRPKEMGDEFVPTAGSAIDHIAYSYRNIEPVFDRMKKAGVEIVQPIQDSQYYEHKSFFVMAPGKILVEIVQEKPLPEGIWE